MIDKTVLQTAIQSAKDELQELTAHRDELKKDPIAFYSFGIHEDNVTNKRRIDKRIEQLTNTIEQKSIVLESAEAFYDLVAFDRTNGVHWEPAIDPDSPDFYVFTKEDFKTLGIEVTT